MCKTCHRYAGSIANPVFKSDFYSIAYGYVSNICNCNTCFGPLRMFNGWFIHLVVFLLHSQEIRRLTHSCIWEIFVTAFFFLWKKFLLQAVISATSEHLILDLFSFIGVMHSELLCGRNKLLTLMAGKGRTSKSGGSKIFTSISPFVFDDFQL